MHLDFPVPYAAYLASAPLRDISRFYAFCVSASSLPAPSDAAMRFTDPHASTCA